ncbi:MAG: hypothetical protein IV100_27040 [Myxococcales bacterium]|nr:hypothetical protein [Myxococcales bacterium]
MDRRDQIIDYLYGELSPAERSAFEASLRQDPALASEVAALEGTRSLIRKAAEVPAAPSALLMKLQREARLAVPAPSPTFWQSLSALLLRPAAGFAFVVAAVVGTGVWISSQKKDQPALPTDASVATLSSADREASRDRSMHEVAIEDDDRRAAEAPAPTTATTAAADSPEAVAVEGEVTTETVAAVPIPSPVVEPTAFEAAVPMGAAAAPTAGPMGEGERVAQQAVAVQAGDRDNAALDRRAGLGPVVGGVPTEGAYGAGFGDAANRVGVADLAEPKNEAKPEAAAAPARALIPVEVQRRETEVPSAADPRVANFAKSLNTDSQDANNDRADNGLLDREQDEGTPKVAEEAAKSTGPGNAAPKKKMDYAQPAAEAPALADKLQAKEALAEPRPVPATDDAVVDGALANEALRQQARSEVKLPPRPTDTPSAPPAVIVQTAPPAAPPPLTQTSLPRRDAQGVAPATPSVGSLATDGKGNGSPATGYDKFGGLGAQGGAGSTAGRTTAGAPGAGRFEQAEAFYRSQRYDQAIQEFEGYLAGIPSPDAERAPAVESKSAPERTVKDATVKVAKVAAPVADGRTAEARHRLAESYERTNRLEQASRAYKALLDQHGGYAYRGAVLVDAAQVEMRLGRLEAARDLLRQALADTKMGATARTRLAEIEREIAARQRGGAGSATPLPVAAPTEKNFDDDSTAPTKPAAPRMKTPAESLNENAR